MERQEREVGDLINVMGTKQLGIILRVHERAGNSKFYLVYDNTTNKEKWIPENAAFDPEQYNPDVELLHRQWK